MLVLTDGWLTVDGLCMGDPLPARFGMKPAAAATSKTTKKIGKPITRNIIIQPNPNIIFENLLTLNLIL
jgi:hypothetical protein